MKQKRDHLVLFLPGKDGQLLFDLLDAHAEKSNGSKPAQQVRFRSEAKAQRPPLGAGWRVNGPCDLLPRTGRTSIGAVAGAHLIGHSRQTEKKKSLSVNFF